MRALHVGMATTLALLVSTLSAEEVWETSLNHASQLRAKRSPEAEQAYRTAAQQARLVDDGGAALALVYTGLGGLYMDEGRYTESEAVLRQSLRAQEGNPLTSPRDLAHTLHCLALSIRAMARHEEAETLHLKAIGTLESGPDPSVGDAPLLAPLLIGLGTLYLDRGRLAQAEEVFNRALRIGEGMGEPGHAHVGAALAELSQLYLLRGDLGKAGQSATRALAMIEAAYGPNHFEVARSLTYRARVYFTQQRYREARESWLRSLRILESWWGAEHDDTLTVLMQLSNVAILERRYEEAEQVTRKALQAAEARPVARAFLAQALHHLALIYAAQRRHTEAWPHFRRSISITEVELGPSSPELGSCLAHYAQSLFAGGNAQQAEPLLRRAIVVLEQTSGQELSWLPELLEQHGQILRKLKRNEEAREVEKHTSDLRAASTSHLPGKHTVDVTTLRTQR